ncbi:autotransporter outer membrane beta-barrel domain-containing protein [Sedimentitalea sp. HM32M-2]|uniref:autotransporter family protein n=1 Tax=Sedimentitalea sp. HM32M-2 TaxID=3351566 RepID=UPI00362D0D63
MDFTNPLYSNFENVYIGSTRGDGSRTPLTMTSAPDGRPGQPDVLKVRLDFGRLTLENTELTVRRGIVNPTEIGEITSLTLGNTTAGRSGALVLRNASLSIVDATDFSLTSPAEAPEIVAEMGSNVLAQGDQGGIADELRMAVEPGATLHFQGTVAEARVGGTLSVGTGAQLLLDESFVNLSQPQSSGLARPVIDNAAVVLRGTKADLALTNPLFRDSTITLDNGATLSVVTRGAPSGFLGSTLTFEGDNLITFEDGQSVIRGSGPVVSDMNMVFGSGTTRFVGDSIPGTNGGLRASFMTVDSGTLDLRDLRVNERTTSGLGGLVLRNGATFQDSFESAYRGMSVLTVENSSLRTVSGLGAFSSPHNGIQRARFVDATIDIAGATRTGISGTAQPAALSDLEINAQRLIFEGDTHVRVGIDPQGECVLADGACIPGTENFEGGLIFNVGNAADSEFTGFGNVLFVPLANDPTATANDYINGGRNGIYTVARSNTSDGILFSPQGFDVAPSTPTAADLSAAGSNLPANLTYVIANQPVTDEQVDISFVDVGLTNNPKIAPNYTPQFTNTVVVEPVMGNTQAINISVLSDPDTTQPVTWTVVEPTTAYVTTITQTVQVDPVTQQKEQIIGTIVTEPGGEVVSTDSVTVPVDSNGAAQVITTVVTEPNGDHVVTTTDVATLDPAQGTTNTAALSQLSVNSGMPLTHNGLQRVETLHPEAYASFLTVALEQSDLRRNMVLSNANGRATGNGRINGVTAEGRNVWFDAGLTRGEVDADGGLAGFNYDLNQFILGADIWADGRSRVGVYAGYGSYAMTDHTTSTDTLDLSSDAFSIGAYGVRETNEWALSGMVGLALGKTDATRDAAVGSVANRHEASFDHRTFEMAVRAEYTALPSVGGWHVAPEVGLGYAHYEQDGFTESGDRSTALALDDATAESLIGSLGVHVSGPAFAGGLVPIGFLRYEHDFLAASDGKHDIDAALAASPGISQSFVGTHRGESAISVGLGLGTVIGASVDASAGVVYQKNSNGDEIGGGVRVTWRF